MGSMMTRDYRVCALIGHDNYNEFRKLFQAAIFFFSFFFFPGRNLVPTVSDISGLVVQVYLLLLN